jgi:hypothetical protein
VEIDPTGFGLAQAVVRKLSDLETTSSGSRDALRNVCEIETLTSKEPESLALYLFLVKILGRLRFSDLAGRGLPSAFSLPSARPRPSVFLSPFRAAWFNCFFAYALHPGSLRFRPV